jgi:hypothetical protein
MINDKNCILKVEVHWMRMSRFRKRRGRKEEKEKEKEEQNN